MTAALTADPTSRTRVIVAHRLSSIRAADRVLFLEDVRTVRERDEKVRTMEEAWQRQRRNAELFASQGAQRRTPGIVTGEPPAQTNGQK